MRWGIPVVVVVVLSAARVRASSATPPKADGGLASADSRRLPRYLTIELRRDGAWVIDGVKKSSFAELESAAQAAAASRSFAGVVLFGEIGSNSPGKKLFDLLSRAGLGPVRHAARATPPALSGLVAIDPPPHAERAQAAPIAPAGGGDMPPGLSTSSSAESEPSGAGQLELLTVGLHVAGPANEERQRRKLVATFERHFDAFRRCHALARPHSQNASFGVDLLIPAGGGKATVRQTRTRIAGDEFQSCMHRAFRAIHFDPLPTARPEIVSYSVLFKPPTK